MRKASEIKKKKKKKKKKNHLISRNPESSLILTLLLKSHYGYSLKVLTNVGHKNPMTFTAQIIENGEKWHTRKNLFLIYFELSRRKNQHLIQITLSNQR